MGNWFTRQCDHGHDGQTAGSSLSRPTTDVNEANDAKSRSFHVYLGNQKSARNIYEHETACEFLENVYSEINKHNYEVVLHCPLNKQIVLRDKDEISDYWDDIDYIQVVPAGTGENRDADNSLIDSAIQVRSK